MSLPYEPSCGPKVYRSCSWCHRSNRVYANARGICDGCGHRADLPRLDCDCPQCVPDLVPDLTDLLSTEFVDGAELGGEG